MGVIEFRLYYTRTIGNSSENVRRIPTKRGNEIRCNEPFKCAKISSRLEYAFVFFVGSCKVCKMNNKNNDEIKTKIWSLVSILSDFLQIW